MECGGLSVMVGTGTPGMPLWCADSCATSMKVRTQFFLQFNTKNFITYTLLLGLIKVHPPLLLQAIKTWSSVKIALSWLLVEVIGNGEVLER